MITKTNYMAGLQCLKYVWQRVHCHEEDSGATAADTPVRLQGQEVGIQARALFPDGFLVDTALTLAGRLEATRNALPRRRPIYEAAVGAGDLYAQLDMLVPNGGRWDIVEVKSATEIDDTYIQDVAFQKWVCKKAGLPVHRCHIVTINGEYVRRGAINPKKLFNRQDITREVTAALRSVPAPVARIRRALSGPCPEIGIGPWCSTPSACPFIETCWSFLPSNNVFDLYRVGGKAYDLLNQGITRIRDIPADFRLTPYQTIQKKCLKSRRPHIDPEALAGFLTKIEYPLRFLDFETFFTPIPLFDGVRPYQQIPFQYSLHTLVKRGAKPVHHAFLAEGRTDPRPALLRNLRHVVGDAGTILTYNMSFEKDRLNELAAAFPEHRPWIRGAVRRLADLIVPFRRCAYHDPRQGGSNSLKKVMPALTRRSYDHLPIADGSTASQEFLRVTFGDVSTAERLKIRNQLLRYCGQDTEGMIDILRRLTVAAAE